jgi:thioredoxin 1
MRPRPLWLALCAVVLLAAGAILHAQASKSPPAASPASKEQLPTASKALPRMVDVGKTWCIPCKKMVAVLQEAELRYKGKATIEFVDLEKDPDAADRFKIQMIPTQIFYTAEGKEFERHVGYLPFEDVEKIFTKMGVSRST